MKTELFAEINESNRYAYQELMTAWSFEWFLTIRLPSKNYSFHLKVIRDAFLREEGGQIGYMGIFVNGHGGPHLHLVVLGQFSRKRLLKDIDKSKWEKKISAMVRDRKGAEIKTIYDLPGLAQYIFKKDNTPSGQHSLVEPWGRIINLKTKHSK